MQHLQEGELPGRSTGSGQDRLVHIYNCEFCGQQSTRRYNIEKHKKRKHRGTGGNVKLTPHLTAINHPYQQSQQNYGARNALSNDSYYQRSNIYGSHQDQDWMDQTIILLRKQVEIANLTRQLSPPFPFPSYPYGQYYSPPNMQFQYTMARPSFLKTVGRSSILGPAHGGRTAEGGLVLSNNQSNEPSADKYSNNPIALKALACEKCLMVDFIPMLSHKGQPFKEISTHHCRQDRLAKIDQMDTHISKVTSDLLHDKLPIILAHLVRKCMITERIYLCFLKFCRLDGGLGALSYPVKFLNTADQAKHRWINHIKESQLERGYIQLETNDELFSFFKVSIDSTFILLAIKVQSGSEYDLYSMALVLHESCLEKVKPFMPKLLPLP